MLSLRAVGQEGVSLIWITGLFEAEQCGHIVCGGVHWDSLLLPGFACEEETKPLA